MKIQKRSSLSIVNVAFVALLLTGVVFLFLISCAPVQPQSSQVLDQAAQSSTQATAPVVQVAQDESQDASLAQEVEAFSARKSAQSDTNDPQTNPVAGEESPSQEPVVAEPAANQEPLAEQPPVGPEIGLTAPGFALNTLSGVSVQLNELRGKPVLISYWVTWCVPCMEELPALDRLSKEFPNLEVLTVNGIDQDTLPAVDQKVAELNLGLPVLLDETKAFWNDYRVLFLPTSFFIDQNGVIQHIQLGSLNESDLRQKIESLLNGDL